MGTNISSTQEIQQKKNSYALLHKILSLCSLAVVLALLLCSSVPVTNFQDAFYPFVFALILEVVSIISTVMAFRKKTSRKAFAIIQLLIIVLSVIVIIFSILHCFGLALIKMRPDLTVEELVGCIILSFVIIAMATVTLITTIKGKSAEPSEIKKTATTPTTYGIESELEEVKSLFEKGLLNEEDYNLAKQTIIKKHYD